MLILSTCCTIFYFEYAEGSPSCTSGQCALEVPVEDKEFRLNQICDIQEQSDDTLIYCAFDVKDNNDKINCYAGLKELDQEVLKLQKQFRKDFGEHPLCPDNFNRE